MRTKPSVSFQHTVLLLIAAGFLGLSAAGAAAGGSAEEVQDPHAMHHHRMPGGMDHLPQHQTQTDPSSIPGGMDHSPMPVMRHTVGYQVPDINMVRQDDAIVSLQTELNDGRPVFLTFIYTACTTICPIASQTFSQLENALGSEQSKVHIVSISIDPEHDTPARLRAYAERFGAGPEWQHYTGTVEASLAAQKAFDVYNGDKMNHNPVTLVRAAPGQPWLRIDGFVTAKELVRDYHALLAG